MLRYIIHTAVIAMMIIAVDAPIGAGKSSDDMGVGALLPLSGFKRQGIHSGKPEYLAPDGILLNNIPGGAHTASLKVTEEGINVATGAGMTAVDERDILRHWEDVSVSVLKVFSARGEYVNILAHTRRGGFWIRKTDIRKMKYGVTGYLDILCGLKMTIFVIKDAGLNLMKVPDRRGEKIVVVKQGFRFLITLTGRVDGNWAEADVIELDKSLCDDGRPVKKYHGWIEAVDRNKSPNIFYFDTGC